MNCFTDEVLETILKALPELGLSLPLSVDDCDKAYDHFAEIEEDLANGLSSGYKIDMDELDDATDARDAFDLVDCENEGWDEHAISLEEFNRRLMARQKLKEATETPDP